MFSNTLHSGYTNFPSFQQAMRVFIFPEPFHPYCLPAFTLFLPLMGINLYLNMFLFPSCFSDY